MTVALRGNMIFLEDQCRVEDAEPLLGFLQAHPGAAVDLTKAGHLHAAVFQILLAFRPPIAGPPADAFVLRHLNPLLAPAPRSKGSP
jgi:hypothetical protein